MKKLTGFLAVIGLLLMAVQAQAVRLGIYEQGALVPSVYHNGSDIDTVVGILCNFTSTNCDDHNSTAKGTVYWTFFDVNSTHVTDGKFTCTDDDLYGFSWKANSGRGLDNTDGYLVFIADPNSNLQISANAFLVDQGSKDAIFVPVVPLECQDFSDGHGGDCRAIDPRAMTKDTLANLTDGIQGGTTIDIRYWIDATYNAKTTAVIWLTDPIGARTVLVYNDDEDSKSVNIKLPSELNKIIPCNIVGMPTDYVDGFIELTLPASVDGFAYSYISSTLFGAQQTLLAAECGAPALQNVPSQGCGCTGAGR